MQNSRSTWSQFLTGLAGTSRSPLRRRRLAKSASSGQLQLETLETRSLLTAVAVPANLVSEWSAENNAVDVMGLNNATLYNGTTYAAGKVGQAFSFDGVNDRAQLTDADSLKFTASMTIEGWIRVNALPTTTNFGTILFRGDSRGGLDPYSLVILPDGRMRFEVDGGQGAADLRAPVPLGQLIHVAATLDDATGSMKLYENGAVVAQLVTAIRPFRDLDPTQNPGIGIGNANSTYNVPLNGLIDELSVYNRALAVGEVQGIYKAGSDGKVFSPISVNNPSVIEGATGTTTQVTFTIQRTGSPSGALTVAWATADDTATAGSDYVAASGSVTFADGDTILKTVQVTVNGDNTPEADETFKLVLTPTGQTPIMGVATILNDDAAISIANASATEGSNTLKFLDRFVDDGSGGLSKSAGSIFGPDGNLYVASVGTNAILRYDGVTGAFKNEFVASGSGGLRSPYGMAFGPDGKFYVSSWGTNQVLRYDGVSGGFVDTVISGLSLPIGLTFGPDGSLYIANRGTNEVLRYNNSSLSTFVTAGSGGLSQPRNVVFRPDGNMYVTSQGTKQVLRYNGVTGAFVDAFTTMPPMVAGTGPMWLAFGTDGYLYATARDSSTSLNMSILRFNAANGTFVDSLPLGRDGWSFDLGPGNVVYNSANAAGGFVDRIGPSSLVAFTVSLASASAATTTISYSTTNGTALAGSDYTAASGTLTFAPGETTKGILIQTVDDTIIELPETFTVNLSNPTGGSIISGQGVGTILDNDTKFYVIDDASSDRTFEYGNGGPAGESYALGTGNTAPRGAASTAAGTTVWIVDANKNVYVYNNSGGLLGSWTAGGLQSTAQIEGISTNGTDIWLVDNKTDKVFKYAGAASRLSGSQTATSSFSLNSGNISPRDLVTDGASIWVVNDSSTDTVFKYTVSGSLLGSWTISTSGATSPTGVTLDPASPSHLWIVDSGTDLVYQYDAAVSRTSGSQAASTSFRLAVGNTNPQGIADPPQQGSLTSSAIKVSAGTSSVATPVMPPTYASPAASRSVSIVPNTTSELATQYQAHRANWSLRNELTNTTNKPLASGSKKSTARRGELRSETSVRNVPNFAPADQLDGIFEDWSSDPLQLLLRITKS